MNSQYFKNFYTEREFDDIHEDLMQYVNNMNNPENDLYDEMYNFTSENNAYSVIVNANYRILVSSHTDYTIVVNDNITDNDYEVLIPNNNYDYTNGESITLTVYQYNESYVTPTSITVNDGNIYRSGAECSTENCTTIVGTITEVNKPNNLNYLFADNIILQQEITKLANDIINPQDHEYEEGYWYRSTDGTIDKLVFIHKLRNWDYIVTVIPVEDTNNIISIVSEYNIYVYATAIFIIFLWSFRLSNMISKPIQNIEEVAGEIAQLNFDVEAHEYNNKENTSLSKSINLISKNLKETLETINQKNEELTSLYEEQSKQVALKKQLVSSISHELKTPLMIMQVTIQGILDGIVKKDQEKEELENLLEEINKSSVMIQDMLQIYRLDDANTVLEYSDFNLSEIVRYFLHDFEKMISRYDFNIKTNIEDHVMINADKKLIKRVVSNYFTNALKYTPKKETIYVEVSSYDDVVYVEVTNYGTQVKPDDIENIWIPFFRSEHIDSNGSAAKGSGIGLYLVSEILKAHNADFGIRNIDNGVTAYFTLKRKEE